MSRAYPTPEEYLAELQSELEGLRAGKQTLYTERRIKTLEQRIATMYRGEAS